MRRRKKRLGASWKNKAFSFDYCPFELGGKIGVDDN